MLDPQEEAGLTLIEMVVAMTVMGIVAAAAGTVLIVGMLSSTQADDRLDNLQAELVLSAYFAGDIQGANSMARTIGSNPVDTAPGNCLSGVDGDVLMLEAVAKAITADSQEQTVVTDYVVRTATTQNGQPVRGIRRLVCTSTAPTPTYPLTATKDALVASSLSLTTLPGVACKTASDVVVDCSQLTAIKATATITNQANNYAFTVAGARRTT